MCSSTTSLGLLFVSTGRLFVCLRSQSLVRSLSYISLRFLAPLPCLSCLKLLHICICCKCTSLSYLCAFDCYNVYKIEILLHKTSKLLLRVPFKTHFQHKHNHKPPQYASEQLYEFKLVSAATGLVTPFIKRSFLSKLFVVFCNQEIVIWFSCVAEVRLAVSLYQEADIYSFVGAHSIWTLIK